MVVAIDGPAGAGKSTVAKALARRLGFRYLDTGAMYRCVALAAKRQGLAPRTEGPRIADLAKRLRIVLGPRISLDGEDVTEKIREVAIGDLASEVAALPEVRSVLVERQKELLEEGDWVVEGRDIGTVVAPAAALKVFLTATPEVRAARRARELGADPKSVLAEQALRDARDTERRHGPLLPTADALRIDTTNRTVEEVVEELAQAALARR